MCVPKQMGVALSPFPLPCEVMSKCGSKTQCFSSVSELWGRFTLQPGTAGSPHQAAAPTAFSWELVPSRVPTVSLPKFKGLSSLPCLLIRWVGFGRFLKSPLDTFHSFR